MRNYYLGFVLQDKDIGQKDMQGVYVEMNIEDLKKVSIRGRVAYGIVCLKRCLDFYNCQDDLWEVVLEKLWSYTNIEYVDDWFYEIAEYIPDSILETADYQSGEFEFLTEEEFINLKNLYGKCDVIIRKVFRLIFDIGTIDIYGKLDKYSANTFNKTKEILELMTNIGIELPNIDNFLQYQYIDNDGWGERFDGKNSCLYKVLQ